MMKGFTPVDIEIGLLIQEWAEKFVWSGRDAPWMKGGPGRTQEEAHRRIEHHCEYLNAYWKGDPPSAQVERRNGTLFSGSGQEITVLLDELEEHLNDKLKVVVMLLGHHLDKPYHLVESELDMDHLKQIAHLWNHPHFKHFNPLKEEVVLDVSWAKKDLGNAKAPSAA